MPNSIISKNNLITALDNFPKTTVFHYKTIDFNIQSKEIELLDKDKQVQEKSIQEKSNQFTQLISILSIALISILSLLSLSLYKNNRIRVHSNELLMKTNKELIEEKEKVEKASKIRAEFLATVSHELRTPLNAINGISYLLLQENPRADQIKYIKSLEFSGNYLLNFINDILEINRLESSKIELEHISFNLKELVNNINASFNEIIFTNNVTFLTNFDPLIKYNIISDPTRLSQIIINLLNNAIKFSKNGNVWFTISQKLDANNKVVIHFEIKDTGIGIPYEKQKEIFESFSQGAIAINRTYGGTGLGLSIVKKTLELFQSDIHLVSEPKKGATFSFEIEFEKDNAILATTVNPTVNISYKNKKILLVEDNKINQMITLKLLRNKEAVVTLVESGEAAIKNLKTTTYDLILMDIHLPGINGTEATTQIRKFNTITPIIALTAISLDENREHLLSFGMNDVITKPFKPDSFYDSISKYLAV
ncbi:ATP-binding protein [Flavobacterium sp.]|uniref:ATP-binding protein n=1 Tax=Flavobacterium sp. TaxID=239 RepID=UPI003529A952